MAIDQPSDLPAPAKMAVSSTVRGVHSGEEVISGNQESSQGSRWPPNEDGCGVHVLSTKSTEDQNMAVVRDHGHVATCSETSSITVAPCTTWS